MYRQTGVCFCVCVCGYMLVCVRISLDMSMCNEGSPKAQRHYGLTHLKCQHYSFCVNPFVINVLGEVNESYGGEKVGNT